MIISFQLFHQIIQRTDVEILAAGSRNYVTAKFETLTEDWKAPITAIFGDYAVVLDEDNQCVVPWEVLETPGCFSVSAFCGNLHTATGVAVPVQPSGYVEGKTPQPPTPSVYLQLTGMIQTAVDTANEVKERADAGEFDGEPGPQGPKGADGSMSFQDLTESQKQSLQGKSAYAYAQEGGFTGTEAEFARKMAGEAALENLLDNSDFTHFIAQAGLGGSHGSDAYAGDRWILRNGSISGTKRSNGLGYTDIQISHTTGEYCDLVQLTPDYDQIAGEAYTVALENADGKRYCGNFQVGAQAGAITLGDVKFYSTPTQHFIFRVSDQKTVSIRWLMVIPGTYSLDTLPRYRGKGYAAELQGCRMYYENSWNGTTKNAACQTSAFIWSASSADGVIPYKASKRIIPTVIFYPDASNAAWQIYLAGVGYVDVGGVSTFNRTGLDSLGFRLAKASGDGSTWNMGETVTVRGHWEACADL